MRFLRIKNAPHVKLWVGEMAKVGLSDLVKAVDSKFGAKLTVKLEFTGTVFKCDNCLGCLIRSNNNRIICTAQMDIAVCFVN